jgi:hypothetical protein
VLAFWITMHRIIEHVTGGDQALMLLGLGVCFVGTHLGFYSTAISSEALSYPCLALVVLAAIETRRWGPLECFILGVPAAMLVTVRPQLGLFVLAPLSVAMIGILRDPAPAFRKLVTLATLAVPLVIAVAEIMVTNRWMTGSPFGSPYSFAGEGFRSVDFARPEIAAVLIHPLHGLLVYHPLFALVLVLPLVMVAQRRSTHEKMLLAAMAAAAFIHLYLHASWYVWWLGGWTFGSRGMGISAVVLVPILCKYLAERRQDRSTGILLAFILAASTWSGLLLLQDITQFHSYQQVWLAQIGYLEHLLLGRSAAVLASIAGVVTAGLWLGLKDSLDAPGRRFVLAACPLIAVALFHLVSRTSGGWVPIRFLILITLAMAASYALMWRLPRRWRQQPQAARLRMVVGAGFAAVFVVSTCLFLRLAVRTQQAITDRSVALDRFHFQSAVHVRELEASYLEYLVIDGFERKKHALGRFLAATKDAGIRNLEHERASTRPAK